MTVLYLLFWALIAVRELPPLWRGGERFAVAVWLTAALGGLALWGVYQGSAWRLSEWLLGWNVG